MDEKVLHSFFIGKITCEEVIEKLLIKPNELGFEYLVTRVDLLKVCDFVLNKQLDFATIDIIALNLIGSDWFVWDSEDDIINTVVFDWSNSTINHSLTIENFKLWKEYITTGKYYLGDKLFHYYLKPVTNGERDLLFEVPNMNFKQWVNTRFFQKEKGKGVKSGVIDLFEYWKRIVIDLKQNSEIYLPIDFSDEDIGCFKLETNNRGVIKLEYGYVKINDYKVCLLNIMSVNNVNTIYNKDIDFSELIVGKKELVDSIIVILNKIRKVIGVE